MQVIPYNAQADPKQYVGMLVNNLVSEILGAQEEQRQATELRGLGQWAAGGFQGRMPQVRTDVGQQMAARLTNQIYQPMSPSQMLNQFRLNTLSRMTPDEQKQYMLKPPVTIHTGQKLLEPGQRREIADTEFREKVGLSAAEKNLARKSAEEILKGTRGRWYSYDLPGKTIPDYTQEMMLENYKAWRAENTYDEQTPRKQKELDDIWDAKMALWGKSGIRFDKDNIIGKNEIEWDPTDPEVRRLREGLTETDETAPEGVQTEGFAEPTIPFAGAASEPFLAKAEAQTSGQPGIRKATKADIDMYPQPMTQQQFENTYAHISDEKLQDYYFDKWKHLWPDAYE